ncbi:unnamed protein product, partial [Durusdinium trenchii]
YVQRLAQRVQQARPYAVLLPWGRSPACELIGPWPSTREIPRRGRTNARRARRGRPAESASGQSF